MKSRCTQRFWRQFHALPESVQQLALKSYRLWKQTPSHPSLRFRKLEGSDLMTVRIGNHHRAIGYLEERGMIWVWIGTHAEYDRIVT